MIEHILRKWQISRAEAKAKKLENRNGIVITDSILKFHDKDIRKQISVIWKKRYSQLEWVINPSDQHDFDTQALDRSHRSHISRESHSQDNVYKKNAVNLLD